jgi:hypothetical protein
MSAAIAQFRHAAFNASRVARSRPTEENGSRLTSKRSGSWRCFGVSRHDVDIDAPLSTVWAVSDKHLGLADAAAHGDCRPP